MLESFCQLVLRVVRAGKRTEPVDGIDHALKDAQKGVNDPVLS